jgi:hypothetical protein
MYLNELEIAILSMYFEWKKMTIPKFDSVFVRERWFSGAGFFTDLSKNDILKVDKNGVEEIWGEVGAKLNDDSIDSGYLLYIRDGYIETIEGYTYGDDWPEDIYNFTPYFILWKKGNRIR